VQFESHMLGEPRLNLGPSYTFRSCQGRDGGRGAWPRSGRSSSGNGVPWCLQSWVAARSPLFGRAGEPDRRYTMRPRSSRSARAPAGRAQLPINATAAAAEGQTATSYRARRVQRSRTQTPPGKSQRTRGDWYGTAKAVASTCNTTMTWRRFDGRCIHGWSALWAPAIPRHVDPLRNR
jgi:hypothetical protein